MTSAPTFGACKNPACIAGCMHYVAADNILQANVFLVPCLVCKALGCVAAQHDVLKPVPEPPASKTPKESTGVASPSPDSSPKKSFSSATRETISGSRSGVHAPQGGNPLTGSLGAADAFKKAAREFAELKAQASGAGASATGHSAFKSPDIAAAATFSGKRFDPVDRAQKKVDLNPLGAQHGQKRKKKRTTAEKAQATTARQRPAPKVKDYNIFYCPRTKAIAAGHCQKPTASEIGQLADIGLVKTVGIPLGTDPGAFRDVIVGAFTGAAHELALEHGIRLVVGRPRHLRQANGSIVPKPRGTLYLRPLSGEFTPENISRAQMQSTVRGTGYRQPLFVALNASGPNIPTLQKDGTTFVNSEFEDITEDLDSEIEEESRDSSWDEDDADADIEDEGELPFHCASAHAAPASDKGHAENRASKDTTRDNDKFEEDEKATPCSATATAHEDDRGAGKPPQPCVREKVSQDPDLFETQRLREAMFAPSHDAPDLAKQYWAHTSDPEVATLAERLTSLTADLVLCRDQPQLGMSDVDALHAMEIALVQPLEGLRRVLLHIKQHGKPEDATQQDLFDSLFRLGRQGLVDPLLCALEQCYFLMPRMLGLKDDDIAFADAVYKGLAKYTAGVRAGIQYLRASYPRHLRDPPNGIRQLSTILHAHRESLAPSPFLDWESNWGLKKMEEHLKRGGLITVGEVGAWMTDGLNALNDTDPRGFDFDRSVTRGMWGVEGVYKKLMCVFMDSYDTALPGYADVLAKIGQFAFALARKIRNHLRAPERVMPQERPSRSQTMNAKTGRWRSEGASASKSRGLFAEDTPDDMSSSEALESDWYKGFATTKDTPRLVPLKDRRRARQRARGHLPPQPSPLEVSSESEEERPSPPKKQKRSPPPRPQPRFKAQAGNNGSHARRPGTTTPQRPRPRLPLPTQPPAFQVPTRRYAGEEELTEASSLATSTNWQALVIAILWRFAHPLENKRLNWAEFRLLTKKRQYQQLSLIYHEDKNVMFGQHWRQVSARIMVALNAGYNRG